MELSRHTRDGIMALGYRTRAFVMARVENLSQRTVDASALKDHDTRTQNKGFS